MLQRSILTTLAVGVAFFGLTAAHDTGLSAQIAATPPAAAYQDGSNGSDTSLPLLVPYRGLMAGVIDWSSYGIFSLATSDKPMSDSDWTAAGLAAVNLVAVSTLLTMPNSNTSDHRRLAEPAWLGMAADLQNASVFVTIAVATRNRGDFNRTADILARTCQSCHDKFRVLPPRDTSSFAQR